MQTLSIIPMPQKIAVTGGVFQIDAGTRIVADPDARQEADTLAALLGLETGEGGAISLRLDPALAALGPEGYALSVTPAGVSARALTPAGLFYAAQTLRQTLGSDGTLPCAEIEDAPRFAWRGAMLDVCRHFLPKSFVLRFIDALALHKLNTLQLHLTDDQGWRLEIKKYPKLTEIGGTRPQTLVGLARINPADDGYDPAAQQFDGIPHSGFYTQADAREIVAYAAARHITVVPEIEMPGHAQAAIAAYPFLGCTDAPTEVSPTWGIHNYLYKPNEETFGFLQDVLTEVMDIFPSRYLHVGGDEAVKTQWRNSAECQDLRRSLGLRDEEAMQSHFIGRMDEFLASSGRTLIGWDEILEGGLSPGAVVMSWRGEEGGLEAASAGHDVVMAPHRHTYFDYYQSDNYQSDNYQSDDRGTEPLAFPELLPLSKVYGYEPVPAKLPPDKAGHVLGTQGQLWTEYMPTERQVEYMAFPRLSALAEVAWTQPELKNYDDFLRRLPPLLARLDAMEVNYRPL